MGKKNNEKINKQKENKKEKKLNNKSEVNKEYNTNQTSKELINVKNKKEKKECKNKILNVIGNTLRKKWLVNGYKTLLLIVIIIGIYIGTNILLDKVTMPEIDCTKEKLHSISNETKDKIGGIEKEINITLINFGEQTSIINLMDKYKGVNKNIKIERIDDLSSRSEIMEQYSLTATDSLIIIEVGENKKTLGVNDLVTIDYTTYEQIDISEEAITNAILDICTEQKSKLYFSTNHAQHDSSFYTSIIDAMEKEANIVEKLDIFANAGIPEDCDILIITTLKEDLTEMERDKIIEYINRGGDILLMCGPNINQKDLTNFQKVLEQYGFKIKNGIVFESESNKMLAGYPNIIVEETENTKVTKKLNMSTSLCLPNSGIIEFNEEKLEELGIEYEQLAKTSEKSFVRNNLNITSIDKTQNDEDAKSGIVAAVVTKNIEDKKSKIVVFANEIFASDTAIPVGEYVMIVSDLYNNKDIVLNSISYLNGNENTITIRKTSDNVKYTVTEKQNNIILTIIFIIPIIIISAGIIVWQVRRRKK
ncbi:MAG: GldG family protein [Clostridia bacterium]|nr:GldG family protein [Clostridia bacterium]